LRWSANGGREKIVGYRGVALLSLLVVALPSMGRNIRLRIFLVRFTVSKREANALLERDDGVLG